jgi:uncharacterized membrane protein YczE
LLAGFALRIVPGLGTLLNAFQIGFVVTHTVDRLPEPHSIVARAALLVAGILAVAVGCAFYIGAGLGAGPRDGLMLGLSARGLSVRVARTVIEATVFVIGVVLGGPIGIGTVAFVVAIGPLVQWLLPRLRMTEATEPSGAAANPAGRMTAP